MLAKLFSTSSVVISIFVFPPILPAIAAKQCIKLDILATKLFILRSVCDLNIFLIPSYNMRISSKSAKKRQISANSQNVQSINKLIASMSSVIHCFAAIAGSMREKTKMDITCPSPLMDILVQYVFEFRRTCPNYWWKKFYQHTVTLSKMKNI